jgi:hypothetical protein
MALTGRINKGMVTQDDTTIDDGNDNLGYLMDTDPEIRAESIRVLRMADALLVANGHGTRAERQAACRCELEDDLNGGMDEEEWGGRNADEGVVAERDEVEDEQGGGEDAVAGEAEFLMFEAAVNQFLLAAPMKPEVLGKDAWPVAIAPPLKMSVAHRDCVLSANTNLTKAVEMGKRVYKKARDDHVSFLKIIKQGAAALTRAPKEKAKAEANLMGSINKIGV